MTALDDLCVVTWRIPRVRAEDLERVVVPESHEDALRDALAAHGVPHSFYVATCQRVLLAAQGRAADVERALARAVADVRPGHRPPEGGESFQGFEAFAHLCEVASSLDSLVPGEAQVLGQCKAAWRRAEAAGVDAGVGRALPLVFRTAKRIRAQSDLFRGKVSLVPLTAELLDEHLAEPGRTVAIVGTGQVGQRMVDLAQARRPGRLLVVSRDRERAREVAARRHAESRDLQAFLEESPALDVLVLATRAGSAFLTAQHAERLVRSRNGSAHPLLVLDLSLPRNADEAVRKVQGVRLVQMDDLAGLAERGRRGRRDAVGQARTLLGAELARVRRDLEDRAESGSVVQLRSELEEAARVRLATGRRLGVSGPDDERFEKWYWQTVRHLAHVAQQRAKRRKDVE